MNALFVSAVATLIAGLLLIAAALWRPRRGASDGPRDAVAVTAVAILVIAIVVASVLALSLGGGLFVWGATIVVALLIFFRRLWIRRDAFLGLLASTIDRGLPLETVLTALSNDGQASFGTRSQRLGALLNSGVSLPDALLRVPGLVPAYAVLAARCGEAAGNLPAALHDAAEQRSRRAEMWSPFAGRLIVLVWTVFIGITVTAFWSRFIFPKMQYILEDFEIDPYVGVFGLMAFIADISSNLLPLVPWIVLALLYGLAVYIGILPNVIPLGPLRRGWETGPLLRNLALFAEANKPLAPALDLLAHEHSSSWMRRRLINAAQLLDAGEPLGVALRRARLLNSTNAGLVRAAEQAGNLAWGLRTIADGNERRLAYRWNAIAQVGLPIATIVVGAYVFIVALAQFVPVIFIMERNL
jgi:type II secretory pathway component PulF